MSTIKRVLIYTGHKLNRYFGPYPDNIQKRIRMFGHLNRYRTADGKPPWKITAVAGEALAETLKRENSKESLLVIPAGQSSNLDKVFTLDDTNTMHDFFRRGGRGYFNCGSAYWVSKQRVYTGLCEQQPEQRKPIIKSTNLPLFNGLSKGPLCPFPGIKYRVGFFSDAVTVTDGEDTCNIYLSGGGCFRPQQQTSQKIRILVRYLRSELQRHNIEKERCQKWENAAIMTSVGDGAVLLSMFHPYYGPKDIDVQLYNKVFPNCGTNWQAVRDKLSPLDIRMRFALKRMLYPLESLDFT